MSKVFGVGVIGAGNISAAYLRLAPMFRGIEIRAVADLDMDAAKARAEEFGVRALTVDKMLTADDIDIIVNLTIPAAHYQVSKQALEAGKHVYSEKPFVLTLEEGQDLARIAEEKGLRIGSAPDTFLGGSHQLARHLVDEGAVGRVTSGTCFVQSPGMEMWHPNPDFFFQPGGGPVLDLGPYYISDMVQLLGPVARVAATAGKAQERRTITSQPRHGETIPVDTPTTIHAILEFRNGAQITYVTSWDVWHHGHNNIELYGSEGSIYVPDPNFFAGELRMTRRGSPVTPGVAWDHPFLADNDNGRANYRCAGLADMAQAIAEGRPHRCNNDFALHVVDVMSSILRSGETGQFVTVTSTCDRPAPLGPDQARALLA